MDRRLYSKLVDWKNGADRKPLILEGARQVGKTWLLKKFGKENYGNTAYLSCDANANIQAIFDGDFDTKRIIRAIGAETGEEIIPGKTLIILDEIQEVPRAIQSLKYFCEEAGEYHICVAGSLLGIKIRKSQISFPVGKTDSLSLHPMDFLEYVKAVAGDGAYRFLKGVDFNEICSLSAKWIELLRQYYFTGGMPGIVSAYVQEGSLKKTREMQRKILEDYRLDISKHTDERTAVRIYQVWDSVPQQLAKENKKFIYGHIAKGARAKDFEIAIQWLIDAGLISKVPRVKKAAVPLKFYEDVDAFKLFSLDCGLMGAMVDAPANQILIGNNIFQEYKGAFTEQFVMQQLRACTEQGIYYFGREDSKQEIDFMLQIKDKVCALEVKAEENLRAKSLKCFKADNPEAIAVRLSMSNYKKEENIINIPLYLTARLFEACGQLG